MKAHLNLPLNSSLKNAQAAAPAHIIRKMAIAPMIRVVTSVAFVLPPLLRGRKIPRPIFREGVDSYGLRPLSSSRPVRMEGELPPLLATWRCYAGWLSFLTVRVTVYRGVGVVNSLFLGCFRGCCQHPLRPLHFFSGWSGALSGGVPWRHRAGALTQIPLWCGVV